MKHLTKTFCLSIAIILIAVSAEAKFLYVDHATGNDSTIYANNDESHPWATIGRAAWGSSNRNSPNPNQAARAGDTVIVKAGIYSTSYATGERYLPIYNPTNEGSAEGGPIIFIAQGTVTLQSTTAGNGESIIGSYEKDYITWDGFYIDEDNVHTKADTGPIVVWNTNNVIIQNCEVNGNTATWNDNHNAIRIERASYCTIKNNKLYEVRITNTSRNASAIMLYYCDNITIEHNEIHDSDGGIFVKGANDGPVTIRYNLIYNIDNDAIVFGGIRAGGSKTYQNVIRDSGSGITFISYAVPYPQNVDVVNNTIDNCSRGGIYLKPCNDGHSDIVLWNNIITNSIRAIQGEDVNFDTVTRTDFEHNNYYANTTHARISYTNYTLDSWKSTYSQDSNSPVSFSSAPLYVDESGNDFRLSTSSPCINAGIDLLDLNGDGSTTDSISIGAYITGNEQIGIISSGDALPSPPFLQLVPWLCK